MKRVYLISIILCTMAVILGILYILPYKESSLLCAAIRNNDIDAIEKQASDLDDVNQYSFPESLRWFANVVSADPELPLIVACSEGNKEAVDILLKKDADPQLFLVGNWSAIEATFVHSNCTRFEIAQMLIDSGANVNLQGSGTSALFLELQHAIYTEKLTNDEYSVFEACVELLLENGAYRTDKQGNTYIHYLARLNYTLLMERLITEYPVDINSQNSNGMSALMWAAEHGAESAVKLLISLGADVSLVDKDGKNAYDHAVDNGYEYIAQYLISVT